MTYYHPHNLKSYTMPLDKVRQRIPGGWLERLGRDVWLTVGKATTKLVAR